METGDKHPVLVLAPTHRSYLDFVLMVRVQRWLLLGHIGRDHHSVCII